MEASLLILNVLFAVLVHEAAHYLTAVFFGIQVKRVFIGWRGVGIVREQGPPFDDLMVSLAGPGINLAFALLTFPGGGAFFTANLCFGVCNLLPLRGSDGSRALWCLNKMTELKTRARCAR
jgi:Zn-dependent protease